MNDDNRYTGPIPDHIRDVMERADRNVLQKGGAVYFKFTCAKCGARQTFPEANGIHATGTCEECGHTTDLLADPRARVGYSAILPSDPGSEQARRVLEAMESAPYDAPPWIVRAMRQDEERESAVFQALRALSPHLNARGRRILYGLRAGELTS